MSIHKVAVVIPVYNGEKFLAEALSSVQAQTFSDWECICVDDGSTDGSPRILDERVKEDGRFRVIHQRNLESNQARQTGLEAVTAPYVYYMDADDLIHPKTLEWMVAAMEETPVDFVYASYCAFDDDLTFGSYERPKRCVLADLDYQTFVKREIGSFSLMVVWNKLFRTDKLRAIGFPHWFGIGEDIVWAAKFFPVMNFAIYLDVETYGYRQVVNSFSHCHSVYWAITMTRAYCQAFNDLRKDPEIFASSLSRFVDRCLCRGLLPILVIDFVCNRERRITRTEKHELASSLRVPLAPDVLKVCKWKARFFFWLFVSKKWGLLRLLFSRTSLYRKCKEAGL